MNMGQDALGKVLRTGREPHSAQASCERVRIAKTPSGRDWDWPDWDRHKPWPWTQGKARRDGDSDTLRLETV